MDQMNEIFEKIKIKLINEGNKSVKKVQFDFELILILSVCLLI